MNQSTLRDTISEVVLYLQKSIPSSPTFKEDLEIKINPLLPYADLIYPYHIIINDQNPSKWMITFIATYNIQENKRICIELVAYADQNVVRFLKSPSCIKFDSSTELSSLEDFISERYVLPFQDPEHPYQSRHYSQRLLTLISKIIEKYPNLAFKELLKFLNELLERQPIHNGHPSGEVSFILDETLLLLDEIIIQLSQDICIQDTIKWKKILTLKIKTLIIILDSDENTSKNFKQQRIYFRRRLIQINLLLIIPLIKSKFLHQTFIQFKEDLSVAPVIVLNFMESLLEDIENYIMNNDSNRTKMWEQAVNTFFSHLNVDIPNISSCNITSSEPTNNSCNITSNESLPKLQTNSSVTSKDLKKFQKSELTISSPTSEPPKISTITYSLCSNINNDNCK